MKQLSHAPAEYSAKRKVTRCQRFLGEREQVVPWVAVIEALDPYYVPAAGTGRGRRSIGSGGDAADVLPAGTFFARNRLNILPPARVQNSGVRLVDGK